MADHLKKAIALAEGSRFCNDLNTDISRVASLEDTLVHFHYNERGLRLSAEMTPSIHEVIDRVCNRLNIDSSSVMAFVYASPEIQAGCHFGETSDCLIAMTSSLIELMDEDELAFVIGHEFGHFLLGHGADVTNEESSPESLMLQRAREISADRIGMLACPSQEAAFRALIKTSAGLGSQYLRFDIGTFMEQLMASDRLAYESTHPSIVMRCRALLWFSMSEEYNRHCGGHGGESMSKIDERIANDLTKFVDGAAMRRISEANESLRIWLMAAAAVRDGALTRIEQKVIEQELGKEILHKLLASFSESNQIEVKSLVTNKLRKAINRYKDIAPREYAVERPNIESHISQRFNQSDFSDFVRDLEQRSENG